MDCMDIDYCSESDCYADCTSCQQTYVEDVLCGSHSYSYTCGSYSFGWEEMMSQSLSYEKGSGHGSHDYGSYGNNHDQVVLPVLFFLLIAERICICLVCFRWPGVLCGLFGRRLLLGERLLCRL